MNRKRTVKYMMLYIKNIRTVTIYHQRIYVYIYICLSTLILQSNVCSACLSVAISHTRYWWLVNSRNNHYSKFFELRMILIFFCPLP